MSTHFLSRSFVLIFLLFMMVGAQASELILQDYSSARVVFRSHQQVDEYRLALGSYRKTEGIWQPSRQQRLSGELTQLTLELPPNHSAESGFQFYSEQLQKYNRRELFSCRARDCGASNTWANNHFKIIQLYGLDQFQFYGAYEVMTESPTPYYVSIYSVQRGNKRVYVQVDILRSDKARVGMLAANPDTIVNLLDSNGFYVFPDPVTDNQNGTPELQINQVHLQALVTTLQRQPQWKIGLVGHDYHSADLAVQQQHSNHYATQLKVALVRQGIAAERINTYGLGGLAPAGRGDLSARVEVILLR
jgi:hypothetical protein